MEKNIQKFKIGDKVVPKDDEYRKNLLRYHDAIYGIIDRLQQEGISPIVSWINHKGIVVDRDYCSLRVGSSDMYFYE